MATPTKGASEADVFLLELKKAETLSTALVDLQKRLHEKIRASQGSIEKGKLLADSLSALAGHIKGDKDGLINLQTVLQEAVRLCKMFEMLHANFTAILCSQVQSAVDEFIWQELEATRCQRKKYEKSSSCFDSAVNKLNALRAQQQKLPSSKQPDPSRVAEIENDHSKAQRRFASMQQLTQVMLGDLADQITIQLTGALLSYIDAASDLFARGNAAFTDFKPKLEMYKQAQSKKLATYLRGMKGSKSDTHSVRTGILEKLNEKKKSWTSRLFVLKYRWLLYYEGSEAKRMKGLVPLRGVIVTEASNLSGAERDWKFAAKSKQDMEAWIMAISSCIDHGNADPESSVVTDAPVVVDMRTKFGVSQTVLLTARTLEPRKELLRQLINEEIGYVANLAFLVQQYHHALRDDPALKKDLGIDIDEHLFSKADSLWMEHSDGLTKMQILLEKWPSDIGAYFLGKEHVWKLYVAYAANYSTAVFHLDRLRKTSKAFEALLKKIATANPDKPEIDELLLLPLNRISQYTRFLQQYKDLTPTSDPLYERLLQAEEIIKAVGETVEHGNKQASDLAKLIEYNKKFENLDVPLVTLNRRFVKEGVLTMSVENGPKVEAAIFLFSDLLVYTKKQSLLSRRFKVEGKINLQKAILTESGFDAFSFLMVENSTRFFSFTASAIGEKQEWVKLISSCIAEIKETQTVFGVSVAELMSSRRFKGSDLPTFLERAYAFLSAPSSLATEGLFRLSGQQSQVEHYRTQLDQGAQQQKQQLAAVIERRRECSDRVLTGKDVEFPPDTDPAVVAALVKMWFRELPEPIFTFALYDEFVAIAGMDANDDSRAQLERLRDAIMKLPALNRQILQPTFKLMAQVAANSAVNKMSSKNLAIVFGPNMLSKRSAAFAGSATNLSTVNMSQDVVQLIIDNYDYLFAEQEKEANARAAARALEEKDRGKAMSVREKMLFSLRLTNSGSFIHSGPPSSAGRERSGGCGTPSRERPSITTETRPSCEVTAAEDAAHAECKGSVSGSPSQQPHEAIVKSGWIEAKGKAKGRWKMKYFVLRRRVLAYGRNESFESLGGGRQRTIRLQACHISLRSSKKRPYTLVLRAADRKYRLSFKSEEERQEWHQALIASSDSMGSLQQEARDRDSRKLSVSNIAPPTKSPLRSPASAVLSSSRGSEMTSSSASMMPSSPSETLPQEPLAASLAVAAAALPATASVSAVAGHGSAAPTVEPAAPLQPSDLNTDPGAFMGSVSSQLFALTVAMTNPADQSDMVSALALEGAREIDKSSSEARTFASARLPVKKISDAVASPKPPVQTSIPVPLQEVSSAVPPAPVRLSGESDLATLPASSASAPPPAPPGTSKLEGAASGTDARTP